MHKGLDMPVACFGHLLDTPSAGTARSFLDTGDHLAFDEDPPPNESIDLQQAQIQMVRTTRRAVDLSEGQ